MSDEILYGVRKVPEIDGKDEADAAVLYGGLLHAGNLQQMAEPLLQEEHFHVERPSLDVLVIIVEVGVVNHRLILCHPSVVVGQHACECCLPASYVPGYGYMHVCVCCVG